MEMSLPPAVPLLLTPTWQVPFPQCCLSEMGGQPWNFSVRENSHCSSAVFFFLSLLHYE